jgi:hypothetical protein
MPLGALVKLRDRVGKIISRRTDALKKGLRSLGEDYKEVGRIAVYGKRKVKARKANRKAAAKRRPSKKSAKKRETARPARLRRGARND